ncbi:MAG: hypothetical protein ACFFA0_13905 [Promethearchaeota archaeon]
MVQVLVKKKELENPFEIIIIEELPASEEEYTITRVKAEEKPIKKAFLKLLEKAKYNPRYFEETISVEELKRKVYIRNYGFF